MNTPTDPASNRSTAAEASGTPIVQRRALLAAMGGLAAGVALTRRAAAGPLDPPPGPVSSTLKSLTEVEPRTAINATNTPGDATSLFRITQPGSYYLTGNITGVSGKNGIVVAAADVSIDLNGFEMLGGAGTLDGILCTASGAEVSIFGGAIRGWGGDGVDLSTSGAPNAHLANLRLLGNTGNGATTGNGTVVSNCIAINNSRTGIVAGEASTITGCTARANGIHGIVANVGSSIADCVAMSNASTGIEAGVGNVVRNCTSHRNLIGFSTNAGCTVDSCNARENSGVGIACSNASTIRASTSVANGGDGIFVTHACLVLDNSCSANGALTGNGAGIHAIGADNRIEGNNCTLADRGVDVDAAGNLILRNSCSGNTTNWDLAAGNVYGIIINRITPGSIAIVGDSAPSSAGTSDPHANFSY